MPDWGFCLRHETYESLNREETYHVHIDSQLDEEGSLTYADARIEGDSDREYLISTYCCHPSLANDNLSGLVLATLLFERLRNIETHHSYRLVIVPETIGAISYLNRNESAMKSINGGFVVTTVAGPSSFDHKKSFHGDHEIDVAARRALAGEDFTEYEFAPTGSDERQYSTPGFRIPTGTINKNKYYEYEEYHTSKDDLSFISAEDLKTTLERYWDAVQLLEMDRIFDRRDPHCEFKLDQHNLHPTTGGGQKQPGHLGEDEHESFAYDIESGESETGEFLDAINWLMFGCDGETTIFELAARSDMAPEVLYRAAIRMNDAGLLEEQQ